MGVVNIHLFGEDFTFGHPLLEFEKTQKKLDKKKIIQNLLIMPWLYRNACLMQVCEHFMRVRLASVGNRLDDKLRNTTNESKLRNICSSSS